MKRLIHISAYLMLCIAFFPWSVAQAQIKGSTTDAKFANTTVIYKDANTTDARILAQLEQNMGVGDVVRITTAPPRPTVKPAAAITIETPAFDRPAPAIDASSLIASTDLTAVNFQQKMPVTQVVMEEKPAAGSTSTVQVKTVKTASKSSVAPKTVKKTGKIYKHNKRKRKLSWRMFDGPIFEKRGQSKYGCYRF
ncbi:MAG: hypothetical protein IT269_07590 [Saprospiraceae bacterium]|nr:hypothetical protein [Saprospiraceae bacterium]